MLYLEVAMKNLIRKIREQAKLSQQELAELLNVTFATVNRWENGRTIPNRMAQMRLFDFCTEKKIELLPLIHEKIEEEVNEIILEENCLLLYHGSKSGIQGSIAPRSRERCDFGKGFYMGTKPEQPLTLVCDFDDSKFYAVSMKMDEVKILNVEPNIEWAMLVAYHRGKMEKIKGTAFYEKYQNISVNKDVIVGSIANDRMFYVLDNFFLGNITDTALVKSLSALQLGQQYVAVTQKGCDAVRIEKEISLSLLERRCLQEIGEENRAKGISMANEICKNYRREGRFYDEILDDAGKEC